jgi:L-alanine-DL-glutamate epimerase-like enolase superfamily enzyme
VLWGDTIEETRRLTTEFRQLGFRAVKFGFGPIGTSLEQDLAMIGAAREALGPECDLMVDVGRRWTVERAIERIEAFEPFGVRWVEEPLHPDDLEGYAQLTSAVTTPVAAGETEETLAQFETFLRSGVRVVQPDLGRVGLSCGMAIARAACAHGAQAVPHCFGTGINTTASIHWMVATGGQLVEYPMRTNPLCRSLVIGVPQLQNGCVMPSDRPGLGVELDPAIVRQYQVAPA